MSYATVRSQSGSATNAAGTSGTISIPAGAVKGDLLIAVVAVAGNATITWPTGYTEIRNYQPSANLGMYVAKATYTPGTTGTGYTVSSSLFHAYQCAAIYQWGAAPEITAGNSTPTGADAPSLTVSWGAEDNGWMVIGAFLDGTRTVTTYPTGYTFNQRVDKSTSASGVGVVTAGKASTSATDDPSAFVMSTSARMYGVVLGFRGRTDAAGAIAFAHPALAGVAVEKMSAAGAIAFTHPVLAGVAAERYATVGAIAFAHPVLSGTGVVYSTKAVGAITFAHPVLAGVGLMRPSGAGAITFAKPSLAGVAVERYATVGAISFTHPVLAGVGRERLVLTGAITFARPTLDGALQTGNVTASGAITFAHPVLVGHGDIHLADIVPDVIDIDYGAHTSSLPTRVRVVIRDMESPLHDDDAVQTINPGAGEYSRGPGVVRAIIYDPQQPGIAEYANNAGEIHFTLPNNHAQLSECIPYQRHFDYQQYTRAGRWETKLEGLLHDLDIGPDDTIVYGWNYLGLLALSVENARQPDGDVDAVIEPAEGQPKGSKYVEENISDIIQSQLERAIADEDSPVGWIELGTIDPMPEPTTIYSAYVQRLPFIRGLMDSYASGSGVRPQIRTIRDKADSNKVKFEVLEDSGQDRPGLRLEYGSLLQGFEVIPFGDFAVKVYGVGHRSFDIKPVYAARTAYGMDTQVWGNIAKTALWNDISDEGDLTRRVLQKAAEQARIGKSVAIAIRVRGLDVKDGWDLMDAIPLAIKRDPINTRFWQPDDDNLSWWVIWGYQWTVSPDGHDELVLIVRPRIDNAKPLPDTENHPLMRFTAQHTTAEWAVPTQSPGEDDNMIYGFDSDTGNKPNLPIADLLGLGADFGITKISQGVSFPYTGSGDRIAKIKAKGLIPGVYHFLNRITAGDGTGNSIPWNTGRKQCDYFVSRMPNHSPEGYLAAVDLETNINTTNPGGLPDTVIGPDGHVYQPRKSGPSAAEIKTFIKRWFELFPTHPLIVYSNSGFAGVQGLHLREIANSALLYAWTADWRLDQAKHYDIFSDVVPADLSAFAANVPRWGGLGAPIMMQFMSIKIPGYNHNPVDGNAYFGTKADLLALTTSAAEPDTDFPRYRDGYNGILDLAAAAVPGLDAGAGNAHFVDGEAAARADLLDFIASKYLSAP